MTLVGAPPRGYHPHPVVEAQDLRCTSESRDKTDAKSSASCDSDLEPFHDRRRGKRKAGRYFRMDERLGETTVIEFVTNWIFQ